MNYTVTQSVEEDRLLNRFRKEKEHEEYKYIHLLEDILDEGVVKGDRTGTGTKSLFGTQLSFDVSNSFPILTTKKVYWKGVVEELLWFIRGETDSKKLEAKGVKIWTGNTSKEFLSKRGLDYPEGMIGTGYGWQWRNWGGSYGQAWTKISPEGVEYTFISNPKEAKEYNKLTPSGLGIDQLTNVINTLKNNPNDRRMIVSAWNVSEIDKMALPPCHLLYQFDVSDGKLNCQWYQRSVDTFLGLPFNISSYALLMCLVAKVVGLQPGKLTYAGGDTHLYLNHLEQAKEQIARAPYPFPKLVIKKDINSLGDIENLQFENIELIGYQSHAAIKAPMAV